MIFEINFLICVMKLNIVEIFSSFIVMFTIIDILGSIPVFIGMKEQGKSINPTKACLVSISLFLVFFFTGDYLFRIFGIDLNSFAVAGSIVLFILATEMILDREIIKSSTRGDNTSIVPIAFPLIAGPGALTALLSLRAEYSVLNILIGLGINIVIDWIVLRSVNKIQKILGESVIYILRKFFGVILLALSINMFVNNLKVII